jgi:hypothetical protein
LFLGRSEVSSCGDRDIAGDGAGHGNA